MSFSEQPRHPPKMLKMEIKAHAVSDGCLRLRVPTGLPAREPSTHLVLGLEGKRRDW